MNDAKDETKLRVTTLLLASLLACDRGSDSADTASADLGGVRVVSARCEDLYREGSYARDVVGHSDDGLEDPYVVLNRRGSVYHGEDSDVYLLADPEQDGYDVAIVYVGLCPDDFRVTIFFR